MYDAFYGFRERPFSLVPDPEFLYLSRRHQAALSMLELALTGQAGFAVITGEVGSGKTTVVRSFLKMVDADTTIGLITNTHRSVGDLLKWVLFAFDLDHKGEDKVAQYDRFISFLIEQFAANRRTVLIIDEAQNLDAEQLEELRVLSNVYDDKENVLQIILIGQPELLLRLNRPELKQLAQRVAVHFHLESLTFKETAAYIRHRLKVAGGAPEIFDKTVCAAVYYFSKGVPRVINILCDSALVYGFADEQLRLDVATILSVVEDRNAGGLSVFTGDRGPLDRAKVLTKISDTTTKAASEEDPPEYDVAAREDAPEPAIKSESAQNDPSQNDPSGRKIPPDNPQSVQQPQGTETRENPSADATPDWSLDSSARTGTAKPAARSERRRGHLGAFIVLAASAVAGIGIVTMPVNVSNLPSISTPGRETPEEAVSREPATPAPAATISLGAADAPRAPAAGPQAPVAALSTEAPDRRTAEDAVSREEATTVPATTNSASLKEPDPAPANQDLRPQNAVGATAVGLEEPEEILLEDLFRQPDRSAGTESATATLFAIWQIEYSALDGSDLCEKSTDSGLACLQGKGGLPRLRNLNRPALITLNGPNGTRFNAIISSLEGDSITLRVGGRRIESNLGSIASLWSGEYVILWKPPAVFSRLLQVGLEGPDVAWLRRRLAVINGAPVVDSESSLFDAGLHEDVVAFQTSRGLQPDGIVGPKTLIHLNTAIETKDIPVLTEFERHLPRKTGGIREVPHENT